MSVVLKHWVVVVLEVVAIVFLTSTSLEENTSMLNGLVVHRDYTAQQLVQDVFTVGECETIDNISSFGSDDGIGYFENAQNILGLERGIILSTGHIQSATGPNNTTDQSTNFGDNSGDLYLNQMASQSIHDAVGLEFDFQSLDSTVTFRYVFASEEYCEFANSEYNDVFGFFISGPGISGPFANNAKNIALIPGTNDFVSINSVNHYVNSEYYVGNEQAADASECGIPFTNSPNLSLLEYDGFTTVFTAEVKLLPCETYHIRLVIGDVKDNHFDSAVFLEAGSFDVGGKVEIVTINDGIDDEHLVEGCSDGYFHFERGENNINTPLTVHFDVLPTSTAVEGIDFETLPEFITIPAGESYYDLPVYAINDALVEPVEYIEIALDIPCACYEGGAILQLIDPAPIIANLPQIYVCQQGSSEVSVEVSGGVPPYNYIWSDGSITPTIEVVATGPDFYTVTITDDCGHEVEAASSVIVKTPPSAHIMGDTLFCAGDTAFLQIDLSGVSPWEIEYTIDGEVQLPVSGILDSNFLLPVWQEGDYTITTVTDAACSADGSGVGSVDLWQIFTTITAVDVSCYEGNNGSIDIDVTGDQPPFSGIWNTGDTTFAIDGLSAGLYQLTIVDDGGCDRIEDISISEPSALGEIVVDCEELLAGNISLEATGGVPPYEYSVDGSAFMGNEIFDELIAGETYSIDIKDANGCELSQTFIMPMPYAPMFSLPNVLTAQPAIPLIFDPTLYITENLIETAFWTPSDNLSCGECLFPELTTVTAGVFTLEITDVFGCSEAHHTTVEIDPNISIFWPNAFSPNGDNVNDVFYIYMHEAQVLEVVRFQVFNRWGGLLYESKNHLPNIERLGWDGTSNGQKADEGVYVFSIELLLFDNSIKTYSGSVTLLR